MLLQSCNDNNSIVNTEPNPDTTKTPTKHLFPITYEQTWIMHSNSGDSAYLEVIYDNSISYAKFFWDTTNKTNINAMNLQFVYWEGNLKKRMYFALADTDSGYIFAAKNNPAIANYTLNFYSYFFNIPYKSAITPCSITDSTSIQVGNNNCKLYRNATWNYIGEIILNSTPKKIWQVNITFYDDTKNPKSYIYSFEFIEDIGFYKFMDYTLDI
ncbi:MAG: hypothetical protein LBO69_04290 [Ignavibacteria bacterium]|nr:hypothetical protein [Ignavibacteria bacterium]